MCRFNLILIKDVKAGSQLEAEDYSKVYSDYDLNGYSAFEKGYCNCGSFVGSLVAKKGMTYGEAVTAIKNEKLDRLYQVKTLMNQPDYKERKEVFIRTRNELSGYLNVYFDSIAEYETKRTDELHTRYEGKELEHEMSKLYDELGKRMAAVEEQPEYRKKRDFYVEYLRENEVMNDSTIYYLSGNEELKAQQDAKKEAEKFRTRIEELLGPQTVENNSKIEENNSEIEENSNEIAENNGEIEENRIETEDKEFKQESMVIDEVIARTQNDTSLESEKEYQSYYDTFKGLLKYEPSFLYATIWSEPGDLNTVKTVSLESLKIDDLAFLEFNEMLCITR